ncbi:MAG: hypothetical protein WDW38_008684 [Sanguina aurantia]
MTAPSFQAVLLAGGEDKSLFPLTSGVVKALLPVANLPLLSYPLRSLSDAGLTHVLVVASGERAAGVISQWLATEYPSSSMQCEVVCVPEEFGTADALRAVADRLTSPTFIVLSGDLLTDLPVNALVTSHQLNSALATVLLVPRKTSPTTETKPGRAPKNVDYIGLDASSQQLLFYTSSPEALRDLKIPLHVVRKHGSVALSSNLVDAHLYVFDSSVRQDMLPYLTQQQFKQAPAASMPGLHSQASTDDISLSGPALGLDRSQSDNGTADVSDAEEYPTLSGPMPGANYMEMTHSSRHRGAASSDTRGVCSTPSGSKQCTELKVHLVEANYCARVCDLQAYAEVCREVADSNVALHLLGVGAKVLNSVLQDGVTVGDGCHIQNSILCSGAVILERASVKDCQVGPGHTVAGNMEYKGEVLCKSRI